MKYNDQLLPIALVRMTVAGSFVVSLNVCVHKS